MRLFVEILVLLGSVLLGAKAGGWLCRRLKLPAIFGEMLIGSLAGLIFLQLFHAGFFKQPTVSQWGLKDLVSTLAELGVILLLFFAGVEAKFDDIKRESKTVAFGGIGVVILSVAGGAGVSSYFGYEWREAIFVGAVLAATSVAICTTTFNKLRTLRPKAGAVTLGNAAVADALSLFTVLSVAAFSTSSSAFFAGESRTTYILVRLGKTVAFFAISWFLGRRYLKGLREQQDLVPTRRLLIGFVLMAALLYIYAAVYVSSLVGIAWVYLAGVLFGQTRFEERLGWEARSLTFSLFVPLLFISSIGRLGNDWHEFNASFFLAILLIAFIGKAAGGWFAARLGGLTRKESWQVGAGLISGAEIGLIFAAYGLSSQIISPSVFAVLVVTVLATSLIVPLLLGLYQRHEHNRGTWQVRSDNSKEASSSPITSHSSLPLFIISLLIICLSVGPFTTDIWAAQDSAVPIQSRSSEGKQSGLPQDVQAMLDGLKMHVERQAELAELLSRAERFYRQGEALYKSGEHNAAEVNFSRAKEVILSAEEEMFYEPTMHAYFLQLGRQVAAVKGIAMLPLATGNQLPVGANERVQAFVKYFQGKGRNVVRTAFARLDRYEAMMREVFREEGVPEDLIYVGLVESAYNPYAHSIAGAKGIWQFVRDTGRRYGLNQVGGLDERDDPEKSTRAAARYLRDLYEMFGDWSLALAAYNAGEYRVLKVVEKTGVKDFWQMSQRGLLPEETINYVPAVLAAMAVGQQEFEPKSEVQTPQTKSTHTVPEVIHFGKQHLNH